MFDFFNNVVPNTYLPAVGDLFQIACALINRFCPPIFEQSAKHDRILEKIKALRGMVNRLQDEVKEKELDKRRTFKKCEPGDVPTFPIVTEDDLFELTLGIYQTRNAESYTINHLHKDNLYEMFIHKEENNLLRVNLHSKFRRSLKHRLWIEFEENGNGADAFIGHYCECQVVCRQWYKICIAVTTIRLLGLRTSCLFVGWSKGNWHVLSYYCSYLVFGI